MPRFVDARDKACVSAILQCEVILSSCIKEQRLTLINLHLNYISRSADFIPATVNIKYHNVRVLRNPWHPIIDLHLWIHPQRLYYP
jgi:predicted RNA methylase